MKGKGEPMADALFALEGSHTRVCRRVRIGFLPFLLNVASIPPQMDSHASHHQSWKAHSIGVIHYILNMRLFDIPQSNKSDFTFFFLGDRFWGTSMSSESISSSKPVPPPSSYSLLLRLFDHRFEKSNTDLRVLFRCDTQRWDLLYSCRAQESGKWLKVKRMLQSQVNAEAIQYDVDLIWILKLKWGLSFSSLMSVCLLHRFLLEN